jgi:hypothetical protein
MLHWPPPHLLWIEVSHGNQREIFLIKRMENSILELY